MKKAINAWSIPENYTFEECISAVKAAGFDGIEFNFDAENRGHSITEETSLKELLRIKELCDIAEIKVVSVSTSLHNFRWSVSEPREVQYIIGLLDKQLMAAHVLGADSVLVVPGGMKDGMLLSEARKNSIKNMKAALPVIEKYGVTVGVENVFNEFFTSPYDMLSFIDEVDSPLVKAYLDLGNMTAFSSTEYWCDILGGKIAKIHIKDTKRLPECRGREFTPLLEGEINFPLAMSILRNNGFDGYLTAEVGNYDKLPIEDFLRSIVEAEDKMIAYYNGEI